MSTTIATVEAIGVEAPLAEPFGYAQEWVETRSATLIKIEATNGAVGWGEAWGPVSGTREIIEDVLAPHVIGEPPEPERLYDELYAVGRRTYQTIVPLPAISGLEIALWDLAGKTTERSVATLLGGGRRESVRPYATGHYFRPVDDLDAQYAAICEEAERNAAAVGAVKLKLGLDLLGYGAPEDIELVRRVRETVPSETTVMVDANYAYDRHTARTVGRALEELDVAWFEEPVPPEDLAGYGILRDTLDVAVAGGECHTPAEFDRLFARNALDVAQPDVCIVGGLTPARRILNRAVDHGVKPIPHVWGTPVALAASLQLIATLPGTPWLEFDRSPNPLREELAVEAIEPATDGGRVPLPEGPGLGIELDDSVIAEYRVD